MTYYAKVVPFTTTGNRIWAIDYLLLFILFPSLFSLWASHGQLSGQHGNRRLDKLQPVRPFLCFSIELRWLQYLEHHELAVLCALLIMVI